MHLTRSQEAIWRELRAGAGQIVSHETLAREGLGFAWFDECGDVLLRRHVADLRKALIPALGFDPIETVKGGGYRLSRRALASLSHERKAAG